MLRIILSLVLLATLAACGGGEEKLDEPVGAPCITDTQCKEYDNAKVK